MDELTARIGHTVRDSGSERAASVSLALGILTVTATVFTYALSLSDGFNPPNWMRIAGLVWLPVGFFGAPISYAIARNGSGRRRALWGLAVTGAGVIAFVVLLLIAG